MFAFTDIGNIEYVFAKINTQNATSMSGMFHGIRSNVFEQEWSLDFFDEFSTLNVTDMSGMFAETYTHEYKFYEGFDTSNPGLFDTSNVENMSYMFAMSEVENNYLLQVFDLSSVTDFTNMFKDIVNTSEDGYYVSGWASTQEFVDMLNNSPGKPGYLVFGTPVM